MNTKETIAPVPYERAEVSRTFICQMAAWLDEENFEGFLDACDPEVRYEAVAYSPDLGEEMRWLDHDLKGLKDMVDMIPKHVRMSGRLCRHLSMARIGCEAENTVIAEYTFLLVHTADSGESQLIASGRYRDRICFRASHTPRLMQRCVRLDTTRWSPGLHVPL